MVGGVFRCDGLSRWDGGVFLCGAGLTQSLILMSRKRTPNPCINISSLGLLRLCEHSRNTNLGNIQPVFKLMSIVNGLPGIWIKSRDTN